MSKDPCPFCEIVAGRAPAAFVKKWDDAIAIVPLNPVTEGHVLVIPTMHVKDFASDPDVFAQTSRRAAELMQFSTRHMNVITSKGVDATQSVFHLHLHLVPRTQNDRLALPWYSGKGRVLLTYRQEEKIKKALTEGAVVKELAAQYKVSVTTIRTLMPENRRRPARARLDLKGRRFGRWTVLEEHRPPFGGDSVRTYWLCQCDCEFGTKKPVRGSHLTGGKSTRCSACRPKRV